MRCTVRELIQLLIQQPMDAQVQFRDLSSKLAMERLYQDPETDKAAALAMAFACYKASEDERTSPPKTSHLMYSAPWHQVIDDEDVVVIELEGK